MSGKRGNRETPLLYRMPMTLRWRDLDAFNHVNNATFLTYVEEARIRWFESLDGPWLTDAIAPLMAAVQINYRNPIDYPAEIAVELTVERIGDTSLTVGHRVVRQARDERAAATLHADGHVVLVWIDRASGRPVVLPEVIRKAATL